MSQIIQSPKELTGKSRQNFRPWYAKRAQSNVRTIIQTIFKPDNNIKNNYNHSQKKRMQDEGDISLLILKIWIESLV